MSNLKQVSTLINQKVKIIKIKVVKVLAIEAERSIRQNFVVGGRPTWQPRKSISKKQRGKKLMVISGALKNVTAYPDIANMKVQLVTDPRASAYAAVHNYGLTINRPAGTKRFKPGGGFASGKHKRAIDKPFKAHVIKMPKREFMTIPPSDYPRILRMVSHSIN